MPADRPGMRFIERGIFTMGSDHWYVEEAPIRRVKVESFWIDETPVTNRQFADFVAETGHVTYAEIAPDPKNYPGMAPEMARAGSLVFRPTDGPVPLAEYERWWEFTFGACWRMPLGAEAGDIAALDLWDHPVVHVTHGDAMAYARWAGKDLPTEAEHEFAARGGLEGADFAWGDELAPGGQMMANYWQGTFPYHNTCADGWLRTSPVGSFPANGYGLYDIIGNVWEWTGDWWREKPAAAKKKAADSCCAISNPRGGTLRESFDPTQPGLRIGRKVLKGGSHLCAANHCERYRPAARHPQMVDSSTSHIGFRCVVRPV